MKSMNSKKALKRTYCFQRPLVFVIACGIVLFLCSVVFLAFHISRGHTLLDKSEKGFFSDQLHHNAEKKKAHKRTGKSKKINLMSIKVKSFNSQKSFWLVIASAGVIIRERKSMQSNILGKLPSGAIVIRYSSVNFVSNSSNITSTIVSRNFMSSSNSSIKSNVGNRVFITYPLRGWVSLSTIVPSGNKFKKLDLLQPLKYKTDSRCSPKFFSEYVDFNGGDIGNIEQPLSVSSAAACCNACSTSVGCLSWTFTPENSCWLKDETAKKVLSDIKFISGVFLSGKNDGMRKYTGGLTSRTVGSNRVSALCCTDDKLEVQNVENVSPDTLRIKRTTTEWNHQWPIGTGKFGALVGGTIEREIIPFSIAGLFVIKAAEDIQFKNQENEIRNKHTSEDERNVINDLSRSKKEIKEVKGNHNEKDDPSKIVSDAWKAFKRSRWVLFVAFMSSWLQFSS